MTTDETTKLPSDPEAEHTAGRDWALRAQQDLEKYRAFKRRSKLAKLLIVLLGQV